METPELLTNWESIKDAAEEALNTEEVDDSKVKARIQELMTGHFGCTPDLSDESVLTEMQAKRKEYLVQAMKEQVSPLRSAYDKAKVAVEALANALRE